MTVLTLGKRFHSVSLRSALCTETVSAPSHVSRATSCFPSLLPRCTCGKGIVCERKIDATTESTDIRQTCLHTLLSTEQGCTVEQVDQLIQENPNALRQKDMLGRVPLFEALKNSCDAAVIDCLFSSLPDAILIKDFCGDIPLHMLYHPNVDVQTVKRILDQQPSLATYSASSSGPLLVEQVWKPWDTPRLMTESTTRTTLRQHLSSTSSSLGQKWQKLELTIRAAYQTTTMMDCSSTVCKSNLKTVPSLHMALKYQCPATVIRLLVEMDRHAATTKMESDHCYPLHYFLLHSCQWNDVCSQETLAALVDAFPAALEIRHDNRLPLQIALSKGIKWGDGMKRMLYENPSALHTRDKKTGLVPFAMAAGQLDMDTSTIFSLLRENPSVVIPA